jgi:hypothetical protein
MKGSSRALIIITLSLTLGAFIYFMTRSESIYLNQWMADLGLGNVLQFFQATVDNTDIPHWMIYSLPDALWMLALTLFILMIWDFKLHRRSIPWIALAIIAGILFEIAQRFHIVPGTFDAIDLILIMLAALLPVSFIILKMRLWKTN